ncbi:Myb_DNA-bind_6 domain-containing protein [Cephalotus follicularis]|uniref:Myb_DNA-bind_6 domain-containing protein n=1 Tax=Cephalotus follicularis TaxID=3775 RepID=A0A1Q3BFI3_CEPFO|nr:Myb_DNA-bind_6 domain-containing protein [Cephalotus follicularis]
MQDTMKKSGSNEDAKKKERHIVAWSQQEDHILREQISLHGTDNWAIIASKFKDKTTRQCRRRWYTYLNSDFKKGGWSPEEDMLLCEAHKIFGNRWTEIAKLVAGRTDNAVKNRFSTLCKKRAKYEALSKDNNSSYLRQNNKRALLENGMNTDVITEMVSPTKKIRRTHIPDPTANCHLRGGSHRRCGITKNQHMIPPFAVLVQNCHNVDNLSAQHFFRNDKEASDDAALNNKIQGNFLKEDDPKIAVLMQQAELLSSLAMKVNAENTEQSLENAWEVLQDFLNRSKENDILRHRISDIDLQLEDFKIFMEDLQSSNDRSKPSGRQPSLFEESPASSGYSTGSTLMSHAAVDKTEKTQAETGALYQDSGTEIQSIQIGKRNDLNEQDKEILSVATPTQVDIFSTCNVQINNGVVSASSSIGFSSPLQVTPLFRSLAASIPSPNFSESERNFLLKTLAMESPSPNPSANSSQPPPCKRALLQSL